MPGREDFSIIRARLFADPRAHEAALAYLDAGIAAEATALAAVVGHVAMLGLWASRETDDGVLPGDGRAAFAAATLSSGRPADIPIRCLVGAGLLRAADGGGLYLVGFRDCYEDLLRRRARDRNRKAEARSVGCPADVPRTSHGGPGAPDRTVPDRIPPLPPSRGAKGRPRDLERLARVLAYVARCGATEAEKATARELLRTHDENLTSPEWVAETLARFKWVTKDRLARFEKGGAA